MEMKAEMNPGQTFCRQKLKKKRADC